MRDACPFCERIRSRDYALHNTHAIAFADRHPVARGHTLVVSRCHQPDLFSLSEAERRDVWQLVDAVHGRLLADLAPDGFTIGVNVGAAAGQTVDHAHVHVIARFDGDVADPRGGVRWVLPRHAAYWER